VAVRGGWMRGGCVVGSTLVSNVPLVTVRVFGLAKPSPFTVHEIPASNPKRAGLVDVRLRTDFDEPTVPKGGDGLDGSDGDRPFRSAGKRMDDFDDTGCGCPAAVARLEVVPSEQREFQRFRH
jgi:hypothetical protein